MVALLLIVFYYIFVESTSTKISAMELANYYSKDKQAADNKFLNKEIEINGRVKAYFDYEFESDLLELISESGKISVFCILLNDEQVNKAKKLTQGTEVIIKGRCLGMTKNKFPNSVYVRVEKLIQ